MSSKPVSHLRNLGPVCQRDLEAVGILTEADLRKLGPKEAFMRVLIGRRRAGRSVQSCTSVYLYALHAALEDCDWRELTDDVKQEYRTFVDELRTSGAFNA